jgi:hypothetical protein
LHAARAAPLPLQQPALPASARQKKVAEIGTPLSQEHYLSSILLPQSVIKLAKT